VVSFFSIDAQLFNKTKVAIFPMQTVVPKDFPFFSDKCNLLQLMFSVCEASVKYIPVRRHCVGFFLVPMVLMDHGLYFLTFDNGVPRMR